jgi:hypothetical protein
MNNIEIKTLENELKYNGEIILKYRIEYPQIREFYPLLGKMAFNTYNAENALKLQKYCEDELFKEAKELYNFNKANNYPIMVYEVLLTFTITYFRNNLISLFSDEYIFSGGAHGNTTRVSQNWNLSIGKQFDLQYIYGHDPYYQINILKEINNHIKYQISHGQNQYFENYCELVLDSFNLKNFYFNSQNAIIFFQQYDIAPYSSGIPTFYIPLPSQLLNK